MPVIILGRTLNKYTIIFKSAIFRIARPLFVGKNNNVGPIQSLVWPV